MNSNSPEAADVITELYLALNETVCELRAAADGENDYSDTPAVLEKADKALAKVTLPSEAIEAAARAFYAVIKKRSAANGVAVLPPLPDFDDIAGEEREALFEAVTAAMRATTRQHQVGPTA